MERLLPKMLILKTSSNIVLTKMIKQLPSLNTTTLLRIETVIGKSFYSYLILARSHSHRDSGSRKGHDEAPRKTSGDGGSHAHSGSSGKVCVFMYHLAKYFNVNIFKDYTGEVFGTIIQIQRQLDFGYIHTYMLKYIIKFAFDTFVINFQRSTRNWKNITTHVQVVERMKKASISSRDQRFE